MRKELREKGHVEQTRKERWIKKRWREGRRRGRRREERSWECDWQEETELEEMGEKDGRSNSIQRQTLLIQCEDY